MEVYTGYGDKGMTDLSHTKNVSKSDDRICLMGSVEELMSHIGLVRVLIDDVDVVRMLEKISETLKKIIDGVSDPYNREFKVSEDRTELLEEEIGRMKEIFSGERLPILPGDSRVAAEIDVTRAVARRAERELALVSVKFGSDTGAKKYMNRLSDYFYVLARYVDVAKIEEKKTDMFLVTSFNGTNAAFHVHSVVGNHRVNWSQIVKPDRLISNSRTSMITGIINIDKQLVILLDFENIVAQISPEAGIQLSDIERLGSRPKNNKPILYAEDSQFLSLMIYDGLTAAGFTNLMPLNNGLELWELLEQYRQEGTLKEKVACVVTDIEMPQMDGHRLLKLIKETPAYKDIPVIIFSSLINEDMRRKGEQLGADAQLSKHEMAEFVKELDRVLA